MARSLLENPNFSWATWNPTTWGDTVVDTPTEDVVTSPGITSMYPYLPTGAGAGDITPIMPRVMGREFDETDPIGYVEDDENWFQKQMAFFRDKYPDWATPVGIVNALTGRKDATQSFAGGPGGVGSMAGLYQSEVDLLNELRQAGFLVDTPGGVKTTSGKNVVSLLGGYEEGQEETYQAIIDRYGPNALDILTKKYGKNAAIVNRFKEAEFIVKRNEAAKQKAIDKMKLTYRDDVHPGTPTTITPTVDFVHEMSEPIPTQPSYSETIGRSGRDPDPPAATRSEPSGPPPGGHHGGGGDRDQSPSSAPDRGSPGRGGHHWAKGGRVRYTNGGIVGLL